MSVRTRAWIVVAPALAYAALIHLVAYLDRAASSGVPHVATRRTAVALFSTIYVLVAAYLMRHHRRAWGRVALTTLPAGPALGIVLAAATLAPLWHRPFEDVQDAVSSCALPLLLVVPLVTMLGGAVHALAGAESD